MVYQKKGKKKQAKQPTDDFEQKIVDLARVTRVMAGGKRMRFRAAVVIGDKKGQVGIGIAKGADVALAVEKAVKRAHKNIITVKMHNETIPHEVLMKVSSAVVLLKPARMGRGVIAGGPVRMVIEIAGIKNIVAKMKGSKNKINNIRAVIKALSSLQSREELKKKLESN
ncbi:MAG: 30S ribosomal protein S5 [Patescibacteria group bacterium]